MVNVIMHGCNGHMGQVITAISKPKIRTSRSWQEWIIRPEYRKMIIRYFRNICRLHSGGRCHY